MDKEKLALAYAEHMVNGMEMNELMTVHSFALLDSDLNLIMSTEIDHDPDPSADLELWARFLKGDCFLEYTGSRWERGSE